MSLTNGNLLDEIKYKYQHGGILTQLIMVNLGVFLAVNLLLIIQFLSASDTLFANKVILYLSVPADFKQLVKQPWSFVTNMFLHEGLFHIVINMLWFYWFGMIFKDLIGESKILPVYIMGGLFGSLVYILSFNAFPALPVLNSYALGASAAVMAVVIATATIAPNYTIQLIFIGPVKLLWIAIVVVLLDFVSIPGGNTGGHIAHLGGSFFGFLFASQFKNGNDWSKPFFSIWDGIRNFFDFSSKPRNKKKSKVKMAFRNDEKIKTRRRAKGKPFKEEEKVAVDKQAQIDDILDKISRSGYSSLTDAEKEFLFKYSRE